MVEAYVMITAAAGTARTVAETISELDEVSRARIIAGEFDIIAEVEAASNQELLSVVTEDIQSIENVGHTRTCIVLE
ncbi:Lrp/AsnC family transcription regulator [Natrialba magadii ATCC 43099]|uniref:AsnC family transcriptional regulator n=1 Tax=Natrialba magadii (strain ATCC 43099 / DSM 3394 / CCM 3739 / CIP 104546 / IAM 13178 / JCM 8861 / NBRC 102185 / NCIMB 2190 / MS3) TaxID=547559 RepID=D3SRG6_NATMM|nr:Lrp/AsnC ligand binding domain-containing protein [Natrialba magadii]ADD04671.1 Lrp/AsnC family transcription regulator [Natrialba magadii ATCC 43099]ELY25327.1 AsnC family transcriptional regulator [Natrialba magadii ATCC 43099]